MTESEETTPKREQIKKHLQQVSMLWDDTRASRNIAPMLGLPTHVTVHAFTPQTAQADHTSPEKAAVMTELINALGLTNFTRPFKKTLAEIASSYYNSGFPSSRLMTDWEVNMAENNLGLLEPNKEQEIEKEYLELWIKNNCLAMVGTFFIQIPEDQEAHLSPAECAGLLKNLFSKPDGTWIAKEEFEQAQVPDYLQAIIQLRLQELSETVMWAEVYRDTYQNETFTEAIETIRPVLQYLENNPKSIS